MSRSIFTQNASLKLRLLILSAAIAVLLTIGTFFYYAVENWSYADSFYFSAISLTTRGYGELHPSHTSSKIFTVFYLFLGVAFILYALSSFISYYIQYQEPRIHRKMDSIVKTISPPKKERWIMLKPKTESSQKKAQDK